MASATSTAIDMMINMTKKIIAYLVTDPKACKNSRLIAPLHVLFFLF